NLVKLVFERRAGTFGSPLRTRLVLAFVGLTLFPTTLLFLVASGFLTAAFDSWFNVRVESSLNGSLEVARSYYQFAANNGLYFARTIGGQIQQQGLWSANRRADLQRFVQQKLGELNLAGLEVFAVDRSSLARADSKELAAHPPAQPPDILNEVVH